MKTKILNIILSEIKDIEDELKLKGEKMIVDTKNVIALKKVYNKIIEL